jgi:hypothetical protein
VAGLGTPSQNDRVNSLRSLRVLSAALAAVCVVLLVLLWQPWATSPAANDAETGADADTVSSLAVQTATAGGFALDGDQLVLELTGVGVNTKTFTDRPERDAATMPTQDFVDRFAELFGEVPPNADVSSLEEGVGDFVVELGQPDYDADTATLRYPVTPIGLEADEYPSEFGPVSILIDGFLSSKYTTAMTVSGISYHQELCRDLGFSDDKAVLINLNIVEAPRDWATPPPPVFTLHTATYEIFRAASKHGSTNFVVEYDVQCAGEKMGTIRLDGSVPNSSSSNSLKCTATPELTWPLECKASVSHSGAHEDGIFRILSSE